jgi:DNA-binding CsgD family transcriptional regulator
VSDERGNTSSPTAGTPKRDGSDWPAQWFAQDTVARLVVGRDLAVLAANPCAEAMINDNENLAIRDGVLAIRDRRAASELAAGVSAAGREANSILIGGDGGSAILAETLALGHGAEAPVALTLRDLAREVAIGCADLEPIFGVTPGEHQVIVRLLQGHSSRDIAEQFGKSILTIRTHVKRAYGKIGVKTRGQLFARLLPYLTIR